MSEAEVGTVEPSDSFADLRDTCVDPASFNFGVAVSSFGHRGVARPGGERQRFVAALLTACEIALLNMGRPPSATSSPLSGADRRARYHARGRGLNIAGSRPTRRDNWRRNSNARASGRPTTDCRVPQSLRPLAPRPRSRHGVCQRRCRPAPDRNLQRRRSRSDPLPMRSLMPRGSVRSRFPAGHRSGCAKIRSNNAKRPGAAGPRSYRRCHEFAPAPGCARCAGRWRT